MRLRGSRRFGLDADRRVGSEIGKVSYRLPVARLLFRRVATGRSRLFPGESGEPSTSHRATPTATVATFN